jgi:chorismate mutase / prephenate dehydratase
MTALASLREQIEAVDREIIGLLAKRLAVVEGVIEAKLASASPFRDREREESLIARLRAIAIEVGIDPHQIERLYRVVMDMSVAHQEQRVRAACGAIVRNAADAPLRVTYQGVEGSYSHLAAQRRYGGRAGGALLTGFDSFRGAAQAVLAGAADLALLPIENTTAGSINETYDLLAAGGLHITGEVVAAIEHCLLALPGTALADVTTVMSHPQALAQCQDFIAQHGLVARAEVDTAGSARTIGRSRRSRAALRRRRTALRSSRTGSSRARGMRRGSSRSRPGRCPSPRTCMRRRRSCSRSRIGPACSATSCSGSRRATCR